MKIKDGIKAGIGFTIGETLVRGAVSIICGMSMRLMANDKEYIEKLKTEDPAGYETLQKYIKHD